MDPKHAIADRGTSARGTVRLNSVEASRVYL
jgi:hypothetical protein